MISVKQIDNYIEEHRNKEFNNRETTAIQEVERLVDSVLKDHFIQKEIYVNLDEVNFKKYNFDKIRTAKCVEHLTTKYKNGGWTIDYQYDEGHSMNPTDYMIFKR